MTEKEKILYIEKHLREELRLLISSVDTWNLLKEKQAGFVVNIARDSVCIHFRTLIKFFTQKGKHDISILEFDIKKTLESEYTEWIGRIDEAILHISPSRNNPKKPSNNNNDLNNQMNNFKIEILRLLDEFIRLSPKYKPSLKQILNEAKNDAFYDVKRIREIIK